MINSEKSSHYKSRSMKRSSDRDTPPLSKRPRSINRYDDSSDERMTPERDRRRGRTPDSPIRSRYQSDSHRDEYKPRMGERFNPTYKVLCVSALHPKANDEVVKDTLYREFKKYGDITVRISHEPDERVAYVCFRNYEDAREAKRSKSRIIIFDKPAIVEVVYESSRGSNDNYRNRHRSVSPDYDRYYRSRSPNVIERHRPGDGRYDHGYGGGGGPMSGRDFRRDMPMPPHEFMRGSQQHQPMGVGHHYGSVRHNAPHGNMPYKNSHFDKHDSKKDKFPNYLHHIAPEEDPLATRTLFAGNLEVNITEEELRRIFGRYGIVEDIDIKRPPPGTGNAYAFVRFQNLDMAHRCKVELSGQYIGKFQCKIGYGKSTPTTRIWVGGLGPWTSLPQLEREFDRFGAIKKIDYVKGDSCAYIQYDSMDAAQAAVKEMRGFPLGGPDRRLRIDFADVQGQPPQYPFSKHNKQYVEEDNPQYASGNFEGNNDFPIDSEYSGSHSSGAPRGYRGGGRMGWDRRGGGRGSAKSNHSGSQVNRNEEHDKDWPKQETEFEKPDDKKHASISTPEPTDDGDQSPQSLSSPRQRNRSESHDDKGSTGPLNTVRTLPEAARKCEMTWNGVLVLKNSSFPANLHMMEGDADIVETLLKDEEGKNQLRITQRLRLDQSKLDDVTKRVASSTGHAIFLALSGSATVVDNDPQVQSRPLRNLVTYLKQKEAAGVISLVNKDVEISGVLYAFPPCAFSAGLLKQAAPNLSEEGLKEDHLVVVVVRGL